MKAGAWKKLKPGKKARVSPLTTRSLAKGDHGKGLDLVPAFHNLSLITVKSDYVYTKHQHPGFEIILVRNGSYRCLLNSREIMLDDGGILVVKPGDWHQDLLVPGVCYYALNFNLQSMEIGGRRAPAIFAESVRPEQQKISAAHQELWSIVGKIDEEHRINDRISSRVQDALMVEFFWRMIRALPHSILSSELLKDSAPDGFRDNITRFFQSKVTGEFNLTEISRTLGMSVSTLSRKCVTHLGVPPKHAFMLCKIECARQLLHDTSMSIKEISRYLRFKDQYHFSKVFKRAAGCPPSRFRQNISDG